MASGTYGETILHPLGVIAVFLLALFALFLDRRKVIVRLFIAASDLAPEFRTAENVTDCLFAVPLNRSRSNKKIRRAQPWLILL
jgi:hypothetical protein